MKVCMFSSQVKNKFIDRKTCLNEVGLNTGNMLFWHSLASIVDVDCNRYAECAWKKVDISQYQSFITTDLIWITENQNYPHVEKQLLMAGDRPLVPISVGLQCGSYRNDFNMHPDTIKLLSAIQERAIIGVRGNYTAEVLNSKGIKNVQVIGCPSMYYPFDYDFKIKKKDYEIKKVTCNMRSLYSPLNSDEQSFMLYCAQNEFCFCEQTAHTFSTKICPKPEVYEVLNDWMNSYKTMFFDVDDWQKYMASMDFSIGGRFHGNVVGLWNGIPGLFITVDSRTTELCEHFSLPTMKMADFDDKKDIRYYYDLADYTDFNKNYSDRLDEFITFLKKNNLPIKRRYESYYDRRIKMLEQMLNNVAYEGQQQGEVCSR